MSNLLKTLPNYADIQGLYPFNGAIANKNRIYLLVRKPSNKKESEVEKYVFIYQRDADPQEQLHKITKITPYAFANCEMSYLPTEHLVVYDSGGNKCSITNKEVVDETDHFKRARHGSNLIGNKKYTTTILRTVFYRGENGEEVELGAGQTYINYDTYDKPLDEEGELDDIAIITEDGFIDVDGFDENHIYAVGGKGDVWRYIDGIWTKCGFPSNLDLDNVCCAGDGNVYISGTSGRTYYGKEDDWTALENPNLSIAFKDVTWYDGKVWATNDYGIWWITPDGIVKADVPSDVMLCSGRLHANAGMLLLVGMGGVALLENDAWQILLQNIDAF